jgi:uncharacterized protein (TIGR02147 family)
MTVFEAKDYKSFLKTWIDQRPKGGRGESRKMAEKLHVSTTLVSQVINGDKHFTMETASDLCDHLGLTERETDHFLLLVDYARAGSHGLKLRIWRRIEASREAARKVSERIKRDKDLSETQAATYYSHWIYSGLTNFIAVQPAASIDEMAERMKVPAPLVARVMSFLVESGILVHKEGKYDIGFKTIYLSNESPLVVKQHQNWRIQAFNQMAFSTKQNCFFTMPMSLSVEVAEKIRADLPDYIEKISKLVGPSPSETLRCLNIDWFEY